MREVEEQTAERMQRAEERKGTSMKRTICTHMMGPLYRGWMTRKQRHQTPTLRWPCGRPPSHHRPRHMLRPARGTHTYMDASHVSRTSVVLQMTVTLPYAGIQAFPSARTHMHVRPYRAPTQYIQATSTGSCNDGTNTLLAQATHQLAGRRGHSKRGWSSRSSNA